MTLHITYAGQSQEFNVGDVELTDADVHAVAEELTGNTFTGFVIDRIGKTIYLRPKVPFGAV